jgi:hypothetical protein
LRRLRDDDPLTVASVEVESRRSESTARQNREGAPMIGENFARTPLAFCQLDAVAGGHQP